MTEVTLQAYVSSKTTHNGGGGEEVTIGIKNSDGWEIGTAKLHFPETSPLDLAKYEITFKKLD